MSDWTGPTCLMCDGTGEDFTYSGEPMEATRRDVPTGRRCRACNGHGRDAATTQVHIYATHVDGERAFLWQRVDDEVTESQPYARKERAIIAAVRANPDVPRENWIDKTRHGVRLESAALDRLGS